jgi:hypothetical protein
MEKEEFEKIVKESKSKSDVARKMGKHPNGRGLRKVGELIEEYGIGVTHFDGGASKNRKYVLITKECPICGKTFETRKDHKSEKTTCSYSCSNIHFRSGEDNGNWKGFGGITNEDYFSKKYRRVCFGYHEHKCVVCGEDKMVDVHHFDENRDNNDPENLIPICSNHHRYYHSKKYKNLVEGVIIEYRDEFIKKKIK